MKDPGLTLAAFVGLLVALLSAIVFAMACAPPVATEDRPAQVTNGFHVGRVRVHRDEERKVTCYTYDESISCLRDP